jgi:chromosome segregation ATPase
MLLVAVPAEGLLQFIQVLCWIVLPVLFGTMLVTAILHYRRRKREAQDTIEPEDNLLHASPELVGYTNGNGEYVLFDHSPLIREYKDRLSYHHARYTALRKDFTAMETKYTALASYTQNQFSTPKKRIMETTTQPMPKHIEAEVNKLVQVHAEEKKDLLARLDQLNRSYQSLEQENRLLQEQAMLGAGTDEEKNSVIKRWKEENTLLRDKVAEQEYLKDILEEKKAQINFLQEQVEQRIRNQHQADHQRQQAVAEIEEIKKDNYETARHVESLKNELLLRQDHADKLSVVLCGKDEQLEEKQQVINAKLDQIIYLENVHNETKEQNELLNAELADKKDLVNLLQQQLKDEESRRESIEQKLQSQKQLMRRLYKEFSTCMEDENDRSPVIALRPEYSNKENEEMVIH